MTLLRRWSVALFAAAVPLMLPAQPPVPVEPAAATARPSNNPRQDSNAVVAAVEDKIITVEDLRREIGPQIPGLQRDSTSEKDFFDKLDALQNEVLQEMINRVLIVKEFHKDEKRHVPDSYIDNAISETLLNAPFSGDRSKFLAYLKASGLNARDYRKQIEEDLIYRFMRDQQRKSQNVVSPVRVEAYYQEHKDKFYQDDQVHLRLIAFNRAPGETDAQLLAKAQPVLARLKAGDKFADLAHEFSQDAKSTKGGDWGWQKRADLKAEFADPLFKLAKGQASDPVVTPDGCFVLYVEERKFAGVQPLSEVGADIEKILADQMARESEDRWIQRLRQNAYIRIY